MGKNLVPNPSFEIHTNKSNDIKNAIPWTGIGTGQFDKATVDYYMKPERRDTSRYKGARTGNAYVGLRFQKNYKEYMYVQLTEPLEKDRIYRFKMFVRLLNNENVTVTVKQLGVYLSDLPFSYGITFDKESIIDSTYKKGIAGTFNWIPIQGDYIAHGGEKYIIIGNFRSKMKDDFVPNNKLAIFDFQEAYYYVDDVSLRKRLDTLISRKVIPPFVFPDSLFTDQVIEIKNIEFEKGNERILKFSYKVLDDLVLMLNNHPFMSIQINVTSDTQSVAKSRAKAIYEYLRAQGTINPMTYKGIASPPAKQANIKVEIIIVSQ